ncbi:hypothetical protein [Aureimonas flava]|uniref:hypothetical protein n=1 Tax=Aureimonas flava TaxID=2320271 RepID=UPI00145A006E|nr:hypothetical protein [Aureimonas flava]
MSNRTVPAAAEGLPIITRRQALRTLAAGSAAGALAGGLFTLAVPAAEAAADPCLAFVTAWDAASDQLAAAPHDAQEDVWKARCEPFDRAAFRGEIPAATTAAGAAAAIRKAINFGDMQEQDEALVRAALAYLDGAAS